MEKLLIKLYDYCKIDGNIESHCSIYGATRNMCDLELITLAEESKLDDKLTEIFKLADSCNPITSIQDQLKILSKHTRRVRWANTISNYLSDYFSGNKHKQDGKPTDKA